MLGVEDSFDVDCYLTNIGSYNFFFYNSIYF